MTAHRPHDATSQVFDLRGPGSTAGGRQRRKGRWSAPIVLLASAVGSCIMLTWYQIMTLHSLQNERHVEGLPASAPLDQIKFISVVGLYHTGTTALWNSIRANEHIAARKGIELTAYGMSDSSGYPPCGVPLRSDSSVDMHAAMGNSTGIDEQNALLFGQYGTVWGDYHKNGPNSVQGVMKMDPPHKQDVFYTWWKHTPPQHPVLACHREDTLYVIMVRHPKVWQKSMIKKQYDLKFLAPLHLWKLVRKDPRRLPPMELRFRSLFNVWEYYINGYLSWETFSVGHNCHAQRHQRPGKQNCLGGVNRIPAGKRNVLLVRYEDFLRDPGKVLSGIYSFASNGLIDEEDRAKFVPFDMEELEKKRQQLKDMEEQNFFSSKDYEWEGTAMLKKLCLKLGYSCDESKGVFID